MLSLKETIKIGINIVDYIANTRDCKLNVCDIMKKFLAKSSSDKIFGAVYCDYDTLLDYYLSTVSERNMINFELVNIMTEHGIKYSDQSDRVLKKWDWKKCDNCVNNDDDEEIVSLI